MGYQKGQIWLSTGSTQTGYFFNGSTFITSSELNALTPLRLWLTEDTLKSTTGGPVITNIILTPRTEASLRGVRRVSTRNVALANMSAQFTNESIRARQAAKDAATTITMAGEIFKRFSAYLDDFRVTEKRGLSAGTFATTADDAENVKTGRDAVARYALENKQSANKRFTISPAENTNLKRGVTEPAYGEPGGGIEVIFVDGTGDYTVAGPDIIPEE
jgi:hypothetical protein